MVRMCCSSFSRGDLGMRIVEEDIGSLLKNETYI